MHKQWMSLENTSLFLIGFASYRCDYELVRELNAVQPDLMAAVVSHVNKEGRTLLHVTAVKERLAALAVMLKTSVDVDTKDGQGVSPLYACIKHGALSAAHMLVQSGADVSDTVCRASGETMLHRMVKAGRSKIVDFLLESGAIVNTGTREGDTALHYAARYDRSNMAAMLLDGGSDINTVNQSGETALHVAMNNSNMELAKLLIRRKASVSIKDNQGMTSLHIAVAAGSIDLVRMVLTANSSHINSKEPMLGRTPLLLACSNGTHKMAALLLEHGADANLTTNYRKSVLHVAASTGNTGVLGTVIKFTSNINARAINNMTSLHYAIRSGHTDIVKILLRSGISTSMKDIHGVSPLHMASSEGKTDIVAALLQHDVSVNATNMEQQTALHLALMNGHEDIADMLVSAGCDVNFLDVHDKKAADYFEEFSNVPSGTPDIQTLDTGDLSPSKSGNLHVHFGAITNEDDADISVNEQREHFLNVSDPKLEQMQAGSTSDEVEKDKINKFIDDVTSKDIFKLEGVENETEEELIRKTYDVAINDIDLEGEYEINNDNSEQEQTFELVGSKKKKLKRKNSTHGKGHNKSTGTKKHSKVKTKSGGNSSKEEKDHSHDNRHKQKPGVSTLISEVNSK